MRGLAMLGMLVVGCGPDVAALDQAGSTWAQAGLTSYRYTYDPVLSGGGVWTPADVRRVVTVRNGVVTEVSPAPNYASSYDGSWALWTIEGMFALTRSLLSQCQTAATYDAHAGYPRSVEASCEGGRAGWVLSDFQAL